MISSKQVRIRTICGRPYKVCSAVFGCRRPVVPFHGVCRTHLNRRLSQGTALAEHPLSSRLRTPYIQGSLVYCKTLIRQAQSTNKKKKPSANALRLLQTLIELDTFLRNHCEKIVFTDLNRRRINSKRKAQALLRATLTRWPLGLQAALAVLCSILGTRLACQIEGPELPLQHREAFRRAMQVKAVLRLISRGRGKRPAWLSRKEFYKSRPKLQGRWIAKRLDDYLDPFLRYLSEDSKARDKAILTLVASRVYPQDVRWETMQNKTLTPTWRRPGHPCRWKGKPAPKKQKDSKP
ncbi:MAG: hypothetical protein LZF60_140050 [Nitrospira sp.]|nr:MAG: hypothetical protein LZF60_140050 [Nitrospira sp.]